METGLNPTLVEEYVLGALRNPVSLGPDELAEYARYLREFWPDLERTQTLDPIQEGLQIIGNALVDSITANICGSGSVPVFLGTDAEFLKVCYDALSPKQRSIAFYISRRSLMAGAELRKLAGFHADGVSRIGADGVTTKRYYTWFDNSIAQTTLYQLLRAGPDVAAFTEALREELVDQHMQRERERNGWFTFFGILHPDAENLVRQGIRENWFAKVCLHHARLFESAVLSRARTITIVDIGASGAQPLLLLGLMSALTSLAGREPLMNRLGLNDEDRAMVQRLANDAPAISILLYGASAEKNNGVFRSIRVSAAIAMGIESMKSIYTDYGFDPLNPNQMLRAAPPRRLSLLISSTWSFEISFWRGCRDAPKLPIPHRWAGERLNYAKMCDHCAVVGIGSEQSRAPGVDDF